MVTGIAGNPQATPNTVVVNNMSPGVQEQKKSPGDNRRVSFCYNFLFFAVSIYIYFLCTIHTVKNELLIM